MSTAPRYDEVLMLPRAVRFPVEMIEPPGFDPAELGTWPAVPGRLEYVEGRLWYTPPTGDLQQDTVADVVITLGSWVRAHRDFVLATNEAGMILGGATRAADAAVWRRSDLGAYRGGLRRVPPVLAIEVGGPDTSDSEASLLDKARWYLGVGVPTVWLVLPESSHVIVVTDAGLTRYAPGDTLPEPHGLPGLVAKVDDLLLRRLERP